MGSFREFGSRADCPLLPRMGNAFCFARQNYLGVPQITYLLAVRTGILLSIPDVLCEHQVTLASPFLY
ncbi:uncharacterized protein H6S33_007328 [Morchella sextelata]|uniref:uncharacterized protein n=1 Tax=Morchella sextelata TaxID=1174677 RepID=UPI001D038AF6|nr:uncharacterized protein H6S33_007328 [Morchella sextelata]KAH0603669.1 hypothetical protein H6S33_007328 [Morchella sextelata]